LRDLRRPRDRGTLSRRNHRDDHRSGQVCRDDPWRVGSTPSVDERNDPGETCGETNVAIVVDPASRPSIETTVATLAAKLRLKPTRGSADRRHESDDSKRAVIAPLLNQSGPASIHRQEPCTR